MSNKHYTAKVFAHSHAETGEFLEADVLSIAGGWVGEWLLGELQYDINQSGLFDDLTYLDAAYSIDLFNYGVPKIEDFPPWLVLIDYDDLMAIVDALENSQIHTKEILPTKAITRARKLLRAQLRQMDEYLCDGSQHE